MHADVEETDGEEDLVLLERADVEFLAHRHDEVPVNVAHVPDDGLGVFEREELELVVVRGG